VCHEAERITGRTVVALERIPQHAASRVWTGGEDHRSSPNRARLRSRSRRPG
jgi:hypothetical protein